MFFQQMDFDESLPMMLSYPVNLNEDSISACSEPLTPLIMSQTTTLTNITAEEDDTNSRLTRSVVNMTPIQDESTVGSTFSQSAQSKLNFPVEAEDSRSSYDSFKTPMAVQMHLIHEEDSQNSLIKTANNTPMVEEDSQGSLVSQKSVGNKRRWDMMEVVSERNFFPAENLFEYQWPLGSSTAGEYYILQEQISEFLGVKSFKRKYPDLQRRAVEMDEKEYLKDRGVVTETQCDLGLTALRADEVIDLMVRDYPEKYHEYERILHEKEKQSISEKHRDYTAPSVEKSKMAEFIKKSVMSAAEWNSNFNRERKEERSACFDLQTNIVHYPMGGRAKPEVKESTNSTYPASLIAGQFQDYYKRFNEAELKYLPMNTVLYGPLKAVPLLDNTSDGSPSDSDDSSCSSSSESTRDGSGDSMPADKVITSSVQTPGRRRKTPLKRKINLNQKFGGGQCSICEQNADQSKDALQCSSCHKIAHVTCLQFNSEMTEAVKSYSWQCMDCKMCTMCREATEEASLMFCDRCDRGYHTFCVGLKAIPQGQWICSLCGRCGECGSTKPMPSNDNSKAQWFHQYIKNPAGVFTLKQTLCHNCASKSNFNMGEADEKPSKIQLRMKRATKTV
ncbi:hypothetical protein CHUAL_006249 [Chamberlinius hualienensis]